MSLEKILVMQVAAELAAPVINGLPKTLTLDANIQAQDVKTADLMEWEVFRIFYHAVVKALADDQNWPAPSVDATGLLSSLADPSKITGLLSSALPLLGTALGGPGGAALATALQKFLAGVEAPAPKPVNGAPLPNPGDAPSPSVK
jgi:hypothetical protein